MKSPILSFVAFRRLEAVKSAISIVLGLECLTTLRVTYVDTATFIGGKLEM